MGFLNDSLAPGREQTTRPRGAPPVRWDYATKRWVWPPRGTQCWQFATRNWFSGLDEGVRTLAGSPNEMGGGERNEMRVRLEDWVILFACSLGRNSSVSGGLDSSNLIPRDGMVWEAVQAAAGERDISCWLAASPSATYHARLGLLDCKLGVRSRQRAPF